MIVNDTRECFRRRRPPGMHTHSVVADKSRCRSSRAREGDDDDGEKWKKKMMNDMHTDTERE